MCDRRHDDTDLLWHSSGAKPIWASGPRRQNTYVWFKTGLEMDAGASDAKLRLISTLPYQVFCNGSLCGSGPWRGTHKLLWVNTHDLSSHLCACENELWLLMVMIPAFRHLFVILCHPFGWGLNRASVIEQGGKVSRSQR